MNQLKASIRIANHYIDSLLISGGYRFASKEISDVLYMAGQPDGIRLYTQYDINILDVIPRNHKSYPPSFESGHLSTKLAKIERKRQARLK